MHTPEPDDERVCVQVRVLIQGDWHLLYQTLKYARIDDQDIDLKFERLNLLVIDAARGRAASFLMAHIYDHQSLYAQCGVTDLHIDIPDEAFCSDLTVWGDSDADVFFDLLRSAVENAQRARKEYTGLPANVFWPVVGGFYCAPEAQLVPTPALWDAIRTFPQYYALVPLRVTARLAAAVSSHPRSTSTSGSAWPTHAQWWHCCRCGRCHQYGERRIVAGRDLCPHPDCLGEIGRDMRCWVHARLRHTYLPIIPQSGMVYIL